MKRRSLKEVAPALVPCIRCKREIPFCSTRCPECGVFFQGYAEDFASKPRSRRWLLWVGAILLLISLLNLARV